MLSAYLHRSFRVLPGSWTREGKWLVARWPLRHRRGEVYGLETGIQIDEDAPPEPPSTEAALAAPLLPAMRRGRHRVLLPGPLDAALERNLPRLQAVFVEQWPKFKLRPVPVRPAGGPLPGSDSSVAGRRTGVFASGGVDALFSLLDHEDEIDDLIVVRGFDIGLDVALDGLWNEVVSCGREVADELGKRLIPVRTNLRPFQEQRHTPWGMGCGAAMAHVALLLQPWLRTLYVASSYDVGRVYPTGTHPDTDPLWSTSRLQIVHDRLCSRLEKVQRIAEAPVALRTLRVCNLHPGGVYNCGRCPKCLPTMLMLETAGALKRCATFPDEVTADDLRAIDEWGFGGRLHLSELPAWWREHDPDHALLPLVEDILEREPIKPYA